MTPEMSISLDVSTTPTLPATILPTAPARYHSMARHQPRLVAHAFMLVCFWALVSWVDARAASGVDCKGLRDVALVEDSTSGTVTLSNGPVLLACTRARRAVLFAKHVKTTTSDLTWLAVGVR